MILLSFSFFLRSSLHHLYLLSFPTRRSSDLELVLRRVGAGQRHPQVCLLVARRTRSGRALHPAAACTPRGRARALRQDRKSTRLNSSHITISYAVFCLKKKKNTNKKLERIE